MSAIEAETHKTKNRKQKETKTHYVMTKNKWDRDKESKTQHHQKGPKPSLTLHKSLTQTKPNQHTFQKKKKNGETKDSNGLHFLGPERVITKEPGGLSPSHPWWAISTWWGSSQPSSEDSASLTSGKWVPFGNYSLFCTHCSQGVGLFCSSDSLAQTRNC